MNCSLHKGQTLWNIGLVFEVILLSQDVKGKLFALVQTELTFKKKNLSV